jgi:hypothetical protein
VRRSIPTSQDAQPAADKDTPQPSVTQPPFNGIVTDAPGIYGPQFMMANLWPHIILNEINSVPHQCEIQAITEAAIKACDWLDEIGDGIISHPDSCKFDPQTVQGQDTLCPDGPSGLKISAAAVAVAKVAWSGPQSANGTQLWPGLSHEASLATIPATSCEKTPCASVPDIMSYDWIVCFLKKDQDFTLIGMNRTHFEELFVASLREYEDLFGSSRTDLSAFRDAGGKMLTFHGLLRYADVL